MSHDHNVTLSGSAGSVPYRVSYGYTNQDGILKTTAFNRNSLNVNLTPSLLDDHLKVNLSVKASYEKRNFGNEGAVGAAVAFDPTQLVYNGNSRFGGYFTWTNLSDDLPSGDMNIDGNPINIGVANPVSLLEQTDNRSTVKRILGNVSLDYKLPFFPDLRAVLNLGLDKSSSSGHNNSQSNAGWTYRNGIGQLIDYTGETNSQLLDFYLNYVKTVGESKFDITGGYSYQSFERNGSNFARNGDESIYNDFEVTADGDTVARQYIPNPNVLISFFGRAYYSYKGRYMVTATLRNDLSSRFSEDTRSGFSRR
ncbi:MAG: hypothetical protein HC859_11165 [Bacteroidia bacterium]|nr:hypothetical protein [Bacteroidia bacterium]